jgi:hypothetical protein
MQAALGGSFVSLIGILKGLQSVWREKHGMDLIRSLLPGLSPENAVQELKEALNDLWFLGALLRVAEDPRAKSFG